MSDKNKKITRAGSGRTVGSFSFTTISLAELNGKFASTPDAKIKVGRKWAEANGFTGLVVGPANQIVPAQPVTITTNNMPAQVSSVASSDTQ